MARVRRAKAATVGGVPAALMDPAAAVWHDAKLFAKYAEQLDLEVPERQIHAPGSACAHRRADLVRAWAQANDFMAEKWPGSLDHARLRDHGIDGLRNFPACPHEP